MNDVKVGTVAFLKSTEEPAFVLEIKKGAGFQVFPELSGDVATVRRPTSGRDGVRHNVEVFSIEELETLEAKQSRQILEMEELKARFKTDAPLGVSDVQSNLFTTN
jgi:hypothetical protein